MPRNNRPIIAINETTGERKEFSGLYAAGKELGANHVQVLFAVLVGQIVKGWRVYDKPDKIRERIKELEAQIKMLEGTE